MKQKQLLEALLKLAHGRLVSTQGEIEALELLIVSLEPTPPPVRPPVRPEPTPPVDDRPEPTDQRRYFNLAWERYMPIGMNPPAMPSVVRPTQRSCHFIVEGRTARSTSTGMLLARPANMNPKAEWEPIPVAYRTEVEKRKQSGSPIDADNPIIIGVRGDGGKAWIGCSSSVHNKGLGTIVEQGPIHIQIVGLDEDAKAEIKFGSPKLHEKVPMLHLFDIGLHSPGGDSFVIRANEGVGEVRFDGVWNATPKGDLRTSFIHIDQYDSLVITGMKWKGALVREHSGAYIKSCVGDPSNPRHGTWLVANQMQGGGRTFSQVRPGDGDYDIWGKGEPREAPTCAYVAADNYSDGFGLEEGAVKSGGSILSVWSSPYTSVFVFSNKITNCYWGCLMVGAQGWVVENENGDHPPYNRDWLNENGFANHDLHVFDNEFENDPSDRETVSITGVEMVRVYEQAKPITRFTLDNPWGIGKHGMRNGMVSIEEPSQLTLYTAEDGDKPRKLRRLTSQEIEAITMR